MKDFFTKTQYATINPSPLGFVCLHVFVITIFSLFSLSNLSATKAHNWVMQGKAVTALSNLALYSDSTFSSNSIGFYKEGDLFKQIGTTKGFHEDDSQKQLFRWYQVEAIDGKRGWVFGDGVAVMLADLKVSEAMASVYKRRFDFSRKGEENGFGNAIIWVGSVYGHDITNKRFVKPSYREEYLVLTNEKGKSLIEIINGNNLFGSTHLQKIEIEDTNEDEVPEIILQKISYSKKKYGNNLTADIFAVRQNELVKVFECDMHTSNQKAVPPLRYKFINIQPKKIKVEFFEPLPCPTDELTNKGTTPNCLKHFTETYFWNEDNFAFEALNRPYRMPVKGVLKNDNVALRKQPSTTSPTSVEMYRNNFLRILHEKSVLIKVNGKPKQQHWFYVREAGGQYGYLLAKEIDFLNITHAHLINQYFSATSSVLEERNFIKIQTASSFSNK